MRRISIILDYNIFLENNLIVIIICILLNDKTLSRTFQTKNRHISMSILCHPQKQQDMIWLKIAVFKRKTFRFLWARGKSEHFVCYKLFVAVCFYCKIRGWREEKARWGVACITYAIPTRKKSSFSFEYVSVCLNTLIYMTMANMRRFPVPLTKCARWWRTRNLFDTN